MRSPDASVVVSLDALAVDGGAVGAAEIGEGAVPIVDRDPRVEARDRGMRHHDVGAGAAPDGGLAVFEDVPIRDTGPLGGGSDGDESVLH